MLKPGREEAYDTLHARVPDDLLEAHRNTLRKLARQAVAACKTMALIEPESDADE